MTTNEMSRTLDLHVFHAGEDREISTGFCGDLLSMVMGGAPSGSAWITVMTNVNVAAVAMLCDISCVILSQGKEPDENLLERAKRENLTLLGTEDDTFTFAVRLGSVL